MIFNHLLWLWTLCLLSFAARNMRAFKSLLKFPELSSLTCFGLLMGCHLYWITTARAFQAETAATLRAKEELKVLLSANEVSKAMKEEQKSADQALDRKYARQYAEKLDQEEKVSPLYPLIRLSYSVHSDNQLSAPAHPDIAKDCIKAILPGVRWDKWNIYLHILSLCCKRNGML